MKTAFLEGKPGIGKTSFFKQKCTYQSKTQTKASPAFDIYALGVMMGAAHDRMKDGANFLRDAARAKVNPRDANRNRILDVRTGTHVTIPSKLAWLGKKGKPACQALDPEDISQDIPITGYRFAP